MKNIALLSGATAILAALSVPAFAQTEIATGADAVGVSQVDDGISDIEDDVQDAFDRSNDADRFGPADRRQGLFGNMSASYSGSAGDSDSDDQSLAIAGRLSYNRAPFAQSVGLSIEFNEDNGTKTEEQVSAIYDAQYYFNDRMYAFALGLFEVDDLVDGINNSTGLADASEDGENYRTGFLGFGPGYRILNSDTTTWRVQAGVGVRYSQNGLQRQNEENNIGGDHSDTEVGYIASSRFYHRFNDNVFLTNDTDILASDEAADTLTNELGVNFKMSDQLATRASIKTEYEKDGDFDSTDNTLNVAVVYGF